MNSKRTNTLIISMFLILAFAVPTGFISQAKADDSSQVQLEQFGQTIANSTNIPGEIGSIIGGIGGFQDNILGEIFTMIFSQVLNFSDHEILPGKNVYVFNANASGNTTIPMHYQNTQTYTTYAPYPDKKGHNFWVDVSETYNVTITFKQEAQIVIILWDNDGSLVQAILKVLDLAKAVLAWQKANPGSTSLPQSITQQAAETVTWLLVHINDIITGDEQIIFQPSYYWSYKITGSYISVHTWHYANNGTILTNPKPGMFTNATRDQNLELLLKNQNIPSKTVYDSGFLFHIFQLWLKKFQVNINMAKLTSLIALGQQNSSAISANMLDNLLEGVDVEFSFTQHHLLGGMLFNDTDHNGVPTVRYNNTGYTYNDSQGIKNVTVPTTNEFRYMLDLGNPGPTPWTVTPPTSNGTAVSWATQFNYPTLEAIPVGDDQYEAIFNNANYSIPCTYLKFGFTFQPSFTDVQVPNAAGNIVNTVRFGKGTIKLDQEFGKCTLPSNLIGTHQNLSLCVVYFSQIFNFNLKYTNLQNSSASAQTDWIARNNNKTLDFINSSSDDYFGSIDIAGPNYTLGNGSSYAASTEIVPFAFFSYTYDAQRNIANDNYSISQGESGFRTQSLYVGITSAWAFYLVSYPHWDGQSLVHDPTFSIFMTIQTQVPWGVILLVVVIGVLGIASLALFLRNKSQMDKSKMKGIS